MRDPNNDFDWSGFIALVALFIFFLALVLIGLALFGTPSPSSF